MLARVPASSANLGPGFDCLAVALSLYLEVTIEPADAFSISSEGCGAGHVRRRAQPRRARRRRRARTLELLDAREVRDPADAGTGLVGRAGRRRRGRGRGARPTGRRCTRRRPRGERGGVAARGPGRRAGPTSAGVVARSLALDAEWRFVVVIPDEELSTVDARRVLPEQRALRRRGAQSECDGTAARRSRRPRRSSSPARWTTIFTSRIAWGCCPSPNRCSRRCARAARRDRVGRVPVRRCWASRPADQRRGRRASRRRAFLHDHGVAGVVHVLEADRTGLVTN